MTKESAPATFIAGAELETLLPLSELLSSQHAQSVLLLHREKLEISPGRICVVGQYVMLRAEVGE